MLIPFGLEDLFSVTSAYRIAPLTFTHDGASTVIHLQKKRKLLLYEDEGEFTAQLITESGERLEKCELGSSGCHLVLLGYFHDHWETM